LAVGVYPSNQMYSNLDLLIIILFWMKIFFLKLLNKYYILILLPIINLLILN